MLRRRTPLLRKDSHVMHIAQVRPLGLRGAALATRTYGFVRRPFKRHTLTCAANCEADSFKTEHSSGNLAYLGDALWAVYIRGRYLHPPKRFAILHETALRHNAAEQQAHYYDLLMADSTLLTPLESRLLMWANRPGPSYRQRFKDSTVKRDIYDKATALEALVGYLHLTDPDRLDDVLATTGHMMDLVDCATISNVATGK